MQYDEWQRYPTAHYADRVQMHFEGARRREAMAAWRGDLWGLGHVAASAFALSEQGRRSAAPPEVSLNVS